jgi:hypothetical protein
MIHPALDLAPAPEERIVSPQTLAGLFGTAAEGILRAGSGQRLGSYVVSYESQAGIKQHPVRGRVTHAELVASSMATGSVVTHEVHLPSRDKQAGDFEASIAIFETHQYDETGQRIATKRQVVDRIDMSGSEIQPYIEQIGGLKQ